ncbi:MAG: O-antigen ligase family protein [Patescibacteria group bacterium]
MSDTRLGKICLSLASQVGLGFVFLLPLIYGPLGNVTVAKMATTIMLALVMVWLLLVRFFDEQRWRQFMDWRPTRLEWLIIGFGLVLIIATIRSIDPSISFWGSKGQGFGLLAQLAIICSAILIGRLAVQNGRSDQLTYAMMASLVLISLISLGQYFNIDLPVYRDFHYFDISATRTRAYATLGNPIHLSLWLTLLIPLAYARWRLASRPRWLFGSAAIFGILALAASIAGHAGAQLLIFATYIFSFLLLVILIELLSRWPLHASRLFFGVSIAAVALLIGLNVSAVFPTLAKPIGRILPDYLTKTIAASESFAPRFVNWKIARETFFARPWLGSGPETYQFAYTNHYQPELAAFQPSESRLDRAHQFALDWLIMAGPLGLLAWLLILIFSVWRGLSIIGNQSQPQVRRVMAAATLFAIYLYFGQLLINFQSITDLFFVFLFMMSLEHLTDQPAMIEKIYPKRQQSIFLDTHAATLWVAGTSLVILAALVWFTSLRLWVSESQVVRASNYLSQSTDQTNPNDRQSVIARFGQAVQRGPGYFENLAAYVSVLTRESDFSESRRVLDQYEADHPLDDRVREERAQVLLNEAAADATRIPPSKEYLLDLTIKHGYKAPIFGARIALAAIAGNLDEAQAVKQEAKDWAPVGFSNWDLEIGRAFVKAGQVQKSLPILEAINIQTDLNPYQRDQYYEVLTSAYLADNNPKKAEEAAEACLVLKQTNLACATQLWQILYNQTGPSPKLTELTNQIRELDLRLANQLDQIIKSKPVNQSSK